MKVVWDHETVTVRDVYETLLKRRKVAYTTVMTMMKILEQKKYLRKNQAERAYVYRPAQPRRQVLAAIVRDFVNACSTGSAEPLLVTWWRSTIFRKRISPKSRASERASHERGAGLRQHGRLGVADRPSGGSGSPGAGSTENADSRARLLFWQVLLAACLALPWMRPWRQEVVNAAAVEASTAIAALASAVAVTSVRRAVPFREIALWLLAAGVDDPPALLGMGWPCSPLIAGAGAKSRARENGRNSRLRHLTVRRNRRTRDVWMAQTRCAAAVALSVARARKCRKRFFATS